jgi:hypothetical protein
MPKPSTVSATEARRFLVGVLRIADVAVACVAGVAAYWLRHGVVDAPAIYTAAIVLGAILASAYMHSARVYTFETLRQTGPQFGSVAGCWVSVFGTLVVTAYSIKISDELLAGRDRSSARQRNPGIRAACAGEADGRVPAL